MKKLVEVVEVENEGLDALLGTNVMLFCLNYIYSGKLIGVNKTCVLLGAAKIVYETGEFTSASFRNAQPTGGDLYVQTGAIESFCETKKQ